MSFVTSGVVPVWLILWYNLRTQFLLSRVTFSRREIYECQNFRCWALCARSTGTEARQSTQKLSFSGLLESFFKHDPLIVENGNIPFENSYIRRLSDYKVWVPCEEWPRVDGSTYVKLSSFQAVKLSSCQAAKGTQKTIQQYSDCFLEESRDCATKNRYCASYLPLWTVEVNQSPSQQNTAELWTSI